MFRFHKELINEYNEEVEKYRSSRLTLAVIESYQKPFSCEVCFVRFSDRASLIQHYAAAHTKPKLSCLKCGAKFTKEDTFRDHALSCQKTPPPTLFICDFCPRIFPPNCHPEQVQQIVLVILINFSGTIIYGNTCSTWRLQSKKVFSSAKVSLCSFN